MRRIPAGLAVAASLAGGAPAQAARWERPVAGAVVVRFDYDPSAPFRAGARRSAGLAARPGEPVRAACSGRVEYAGRVPRSGSVVSLRCGAWRVTHLGLDAPTTARRVAAGDVVGSARDTVVRLGVRRAGRRWRYVDPETMLPDRVPASGPPGVVPPVRRPPPGRRGPARGIGPVEPAPLPWTAWAGAALVLGAAGAAGPGRRMRWWRRRARPAAAVAGST